MFNNFNTMSNNQIIGTTNIDFESIYENSNYYQTFICDKKYNAKSMDEYRLEDYTNKSSNNFSNNNGFDSNSSIFGNTSNNNNNNNAFGSNNLFGSNSNNNNNNTFGSNNNTFGSPSFGNTSSNTFGSPSSNNSFGSNNNNNIFGNTSNNTFGSNNSNNSNPFGSSNTFGNNNNNTSNNPFGSTSNNLFGNTSNNSTFGSNNNTFGSNTTNTFGSNTNNPFGSTSNNLFGNTSTNNNTFGSNNNTFGTSTFGSNTNTNTSNNPFGSTSNTFGSNNNSNNPFGSTSNNIFGNTSTNNNNTFGNNSNNSTFGSTSNNLFGNTSTNNTFGNNSFTSNTDSSNIFGSNNNNNNNNLFGNTNSNSNNIFGNTSNNNTFGSNNTNSNNLFGSNNSTNNNIFGSPSNNNNNIFGNTSSNNNNNNIFGNTSNTNSNTNNIFGSTPLTSNNNNGGFDSSNLFGNTNSNTNSNNLFGGGGFSFDTPNKNNNNNNKTDIFGGNLFGNNNTSTPTSSNIFGTNTNTFSSTSSNIFGSNNNGGDLFGSSNKNTGGFTFGDSGSSQNTSNNLFSFTPSGSSSTSSSNFDFNSSITSPNSGSNQSQVDSLKRTPYLQTQKILPSKLFMPTYKPVPKVSYMDNITVKSQTVQETTHIQPEPFEETFHIDESIKPLEFKTRKDNETSDFDDIVVAKINLDDDSNRKPRIINTEEYTTVPSLEKLQNMSEKELSSLRGFKVMREGFGEVEFLEPVNVLGSTIDQDIMFTKMHIEVVSKRINGRARVQLYNCYPISKKTGNRVRNKKKLQAFEQKLRNPTWNSDITTLDYEPKSGNWVFEVPHFTKYGIDFDDDEEEDDEEENEEDESPKKKRGIKVPIRLDITDSDDEDEDSDEELSEPSNEIQEESNVRINQKLSSKFKIDDYKNYDDQISRKVKFKTTDEDLRREKDRRNYTIDDESDSDVDDEEVDDNFGKKINSDESLISSDSDNNEEEDEEEIEQVMSPQQKEILQKATQLDLHPEQIELIKDIFVDDEKLLGEVYPISDPPTVTITRMREDYIQDFDFNPEKKVKTVDFSGNKVSPLSSSFLFSQSDAYQEINLESATENLETIVEPSLPQNFSQGEKDLKLNEARLCYLNSRAFRVGWGSNGVFVHPGHSFYKLPKEEDEEEVNNKGNKGLRSTDVCIERINVFSNKMINFRDNQLEGFLNLHRQHFFPLNELDKKSGSIFSKFFNESSHTGLDDLANNNKQGDLVREIWSLCDILFGEITEEISSEKHDPSDEDYFTKMYRKEKFAVWLKKSLGIDSYSEVCTKNVLLKLLKNDTREAIKMLYELKDLRLASIVSQTGSESIKQDLLETLKNYNRYKFETKIDKHRLSIYKLLAGVYSQGNTEELNDMLGFEVNWKTRLGIEFWYSSHFKLTRSSPIEEIFSSFDECKKSSPPNYIESKKDYDSNDDHPKDILYHLINLFSHSQNNSNLNRKFFQSFFNFKSITDSPLDYSMSWILFTLLYSVPHLRKLFPLNQDVLMLTLQFASQLEYLGKWGWSFYVLAWANEIFSKTPFIDHLKSFTDNFIRRYSPSFQNSPNFSLFNDSQKLFSNDITLENTCKESIDVFKRIEFEIVEKKKEIEDHFRLLNIEIDNFQFSN